MNKYAKIGIIAGAVGAVGLILRSAVRKSFDFGFNTGMAVSLKAADETISSVAEKYNNLVDEYNALEEDYCDLLDELDMSLEEDIAETEK